MGIIASIFGRKAAAQRQVRSVGEDGFVDLDLPLVALTRRESGEFDVSAQGIFDSRLVGFSLVLGSEWKAQPLDNADITTYWGAVTVRAINGASDAFVELLAKLYALPLSHHRMLSEVAAVAVGLGTDPRELMSAPAKMKLFFHSEVEDRYAEVFLNIDRAARVVQFHEKDEDYRGNVLRALTETA